MRTRKVFSLILAVLLTLSMSLGVFADCTWYYDTDKGCYKDGDNTLGFLRFLFMAEPEEGDEVEEVGIRYINADDWTHPYGVVVPGKNIENNAFYGDVIGIPQDVFDKFYAMPYVKTKKGGIQWYKSQDPEGPNVIEETPDFTKEVQKSDLDKPGKDDPTPVEPIEPIDKFDRTDLSELQSGKAYKLGDLFTGKSDLEYPIENKSVRISVMDLDDVHIKAVRDYNEEDWMNSEVTFTGEGRVELSIQDYYNCKKTTKKVSVYELTENYETKFVNSDKYLYRVGNANEIALGSIFKAKDGKTVDGTTTNVEIDNVISGSVKLSYDNSDSDWTKRTLKFEDSGVVCIKIYDATGLETKLNLEVVDAVNATGLVGATANNVVLLNDINGGDSMLTVSNGYRFYGNGFKATFTGDGRRNASNGMTEGFVNVLGGATLDNLQVVCKVFPRGYMYIGDTYGLEYYLKEPFNTIDSNHFGYQWSGVRMEGNGSTISNCYVEGARNNILVQTGDITIDNCVLESGALSNMNIQSTPDFTVKIKDLTTIQYLRKPNFVDSGNTMGFGILVGDGNWSSNPNLVLEGDLKQYNWASSEEGAKITSSKMANNIVKEALKDSDFVHTYQDNKYANFGMIIYNSNQIPINNDKLNQKDDYLLKSESTSGVTAQVYSVKAGKGEVSLYDNDDNKYPYQSDTQGTSAYSVVYTGKQDEKTTFTKAYRGDKRAFVYTVTELINEGESLNFNFNDFSVFVGGEKVAYTVKDAEGNPVDTNTPISISAAGVTSYTINAEKQSRFDKDGNPVGESTPIEIGIDLSVTVQSIPAPEFIQEPNGTPIYVASSKGGDWSLAIPALDGGKIQYYSTKSGKLETLNLSTLSIEKSTTNNSLTITGPDYTLELTSGALKSGKTNKWVMAGGKLYVTVSATNDFVSTATSSRSSTITYKFTADSKTSSPASTSKSFSKNTPTGSDTEYSYSDLTNNKKLTELSSGGGGGGSCITEGTLITTADGTKKAVETLRKGDFVKAIDHETGKFVDSRVIIVIKIPDTFYVNTCRFSDGSKLKAANAHGCFDLTLNRYVNISEANGKDFIGHSFAVINPDGSRTSKTLTGFESKLESGYKYDIVTDKTLDYIAEDTLCVTHVLVDIINTFDFGENLKYDGAEIKKDIDKYGVYTYDEWNDLISEDGFYAYNIPYMKAGVSKGLYTRGYIEEQIEKYVNNESVQIVD